MTVSPLPEPIAIVGVACRFPGGATTPSKLWELLRQPRDARRQFNPEILNLNRFYNETPGNHGSTYVKNEAYLLEEDSRVFDAGFFGISPYEADHMDPQQRILLETVYEMMESAGYTLDQMQGSQTSVHIGSMTSDYMDIQVRDPDTISQYTGAGTARSILSNRISYIFDLHGPSVTIDTACSSSLVALHQAVQGLRNGDANCAIVGGVNVILDPVEYMVLSSLHMLSPDSQSRMWDKTANGYARGEGAAAIMLKPLSQAIRDNDTIEGIVRGTGVNSDGRSPGITMPTAAAQTALIRDTYRRAGLDPVKDRCQYFECHGTGTKAGDPVEARAVFEAMGGDDLTEVNPLYVGSIKTVVGHLEGAAGLAGVLKVLLAMKHKTIPPNLLFKDLNPDIEAYYGRIQIPTSALPWPKVARGDPLRASVNSFGFGGTNAHVIVETYDELDAGATSKKLNSLSETEPISPLVLSAASGSSLLRNVQALEQHLLKHPDLSLQDLTWVLRSKRTVHAARVFFSASTRNGLVEKLQDFVHDHQKVADTDKIGVRHRRVNLEEVPGVLGVFTGQGAQWPTMGRDLLEKSHLFRRVLEQCDKTLKLLPDAPRWSLRDELSKEAPLSRVNEAEISQPLCTAIQLALIEILYSSGVRFDAVVGHSSGEIAAVYACGIIKLSAAMQIAYYRGKYAHMAHGADNSAGAMLAVGIGYREAKEFCQRPDYLNQIAVAASNAPQNVTLSGDVVAIRRAKEYFETQGAFARLLQVDTAYHSHHMEHCASSYLASLKACNIEVRRPRDGCFWNSSVRGDTELLRGSLESLKGPYWVQNMVQGVLFNQAVKSAIWHGGPFDLAIEVGPHPALRRPTEQSLESAFGSAPAYTGTLKREMGDMEAIADTVGSIWAHLGPQFINWEGFRGTFVDVQKQKTRMLQDLPPYSWDHDRVYWREARSSTRFRKDQDHSHELLGRRMSDDTDDEWRWRNVLKLSELPWLKGHEVSGEILLPAASYVSLALEAGKIIAGDNPVRLIEVQDMKIHRPVVVPGGRQGADTIFTVRLNESKDPEVITGSFSYYCCPNENSATMINTCNGQIAIYLGEGGKDELPPSGLLPRDLLSVDISRAYQTLNEVGILHSGIFCRLLDIRRRWDFAVANAEWPMEELGTRYILHPAVLDVCFQNLFHASADPTTGKLPTALVPVSIGRMAVNPNASLMIDVETMRATTESFITSRAGISFAGDMNIYNSISGETAVQAESLSCKAIEPLTEKHDRHLFYDTVYWPDPCVQLIEPSSSPDDVKRLTQLCADGERGVLFYIQRALEQLLPGEEKSFEWHHQRLIETARYWLDTVREGRHPVAQTSWLDDKPEVIDALYRKWPQYIDFEMLRSVGDNLIDIFRGKVSALEVLMHENRLGRLYAEGCGFVEVNTAMAAVVRQISNKFPRAHYLEVGAGTGSTTEFALNAMGKDFHTYTYTDISPGFFEKAAQRFPDHEHKMVFKTLDAEKEVVPQGYAQSAYDVVIASNVLHATKSIARTLDNVRSLLKPGGFLLLVEVTGTEMMRTGFCVGTLPGWWLGADEGRVRHPGLSTEQWDKALQDTGFSGVDIAFHDTEDSGRQTLSFLASQAVNDTILQLRDPLDYLPELPQDDPLYIVGGATLLVSKIAAAVRTMTKPAWKGQVIVKESLQEIDFSHTPAQIDVLLLQELDKALFSETVTPEGLRQLQSLFQRARNMLWVTKDRRTGNPESNMVVGMARGIRMELPHVNTQFLDIETTGHPSRVARTILEAFMRLQIYRPHRNDDQYLWAQETELIIERDLTLVSRLQTAQDLNNRYNAIYRPVRDVTDGDDVAVQISRRQHKLVLTKVEERLQSEPARSGRVKLRHSLFIPGKNGGEGLYIGVGQLIGSKPCESVLVASPTNASIVEVPGACVRPIYEEHCSARTLKTVGDKLAVEALFTSSQTKGPLLVYNATPRLAALITEQSRFYGVEVFFASSSPSASSKWIKIHPRMSHRGIQQLIPPNIATFVDCSLTTTNVGVSIASALPPNCYVQRLYLDLWRWPGTSEIDQALAKIGELQRNTDLDIPDDALWPGIETLDVHSISQAEPSILDHPHLTCWETTNPLTFVVQPPDPASLFSPEKTYLMVGMAGGLGLSICEWALRHGAKNLVITSRNPNIDPGWLAQAQRRGAHVQVQPMDVSIKSSVESVVRDVEAKLPPIGGVCNAAMVLSDSMFIDMDAERFNTTLKPKVDGSRHLHSILGDTNLDFFIMLSSSLTISGIHGQTNYIAANMFMTALAAQRRQNGLAGSVIHVGYVSDVGYTTRLDPSRKEFLGKQFAKPVSETDVHHAFAEAILAGRPGSQRSSEIGMGIEPLKKASRDGELPLFLLDPRFSHYTPPSHVSEGEETTRSGEDNIKARLQEVDSEPDATAIIMEALTGKLEMLMQLSAEKVDPNASFTQLGMDSLVAVEIRTWFLKQLDIDIPVMKLLGREPISSICSNAAKVVLARNGDLDSDTVKPGPITPDNSDGSLENISVEQESSGLQSPAPLETQCSSLDAADPVVEDEPQKELETVRLTSLCEEGVHRQVVDTELLSASQAQHFLFGKLGSKETELNCVMSYELQGDLDVDGLRRALVHTMQSNQPLRTCFYIRPTDNLPVQAVLSSPVVSFKHIRHASSEDVAHEFERGKRKIWNLEIGETLALAVFSHRIDHHTLVLSHHHVVIDTIGMRNFLRDLDCAYRMQPLLSTGQNHIEYTRGELKEHRSQRFHTKAQYWKQEFASPPDILPLASIAKTRTRPRTVEFSNATVACEIGETTILAIQKACDTLQITPFNFHLAAYQTMLSQLLHIDDLCIGVTEANRASAQTADAVGCFADFVPLRFRISPGTKFSQVAQNTRRKVFSAMENSYMPLSAIMDNARIPRSGAYSPLCQAGINYRMKLPVRSALGDNQLEMTAGQPSTHTTDMSLNIIERNATAIRIELSCQTALYDQDAASFLLDMYIALIHTLSANVHTKLNACGISPMVTPSASSVTILGRQIELTAIESALLDLGRDLLSAVVVTVHDESLMAHATLATDRPLPDGTTQRLLATLPLPHYMCPARLILVDEIPVTSSGAIDRIAARNLPLPTESDTSPCGAALQQLESQLGALWKQVLPAPCPALDPELDFFVAGGNSLGMIQLQRAIEQQLGITASVLELYSVPVLRQMAGWLYFHREEGSSDGETVVV